MDEELSDADTVEFRCFVRFDTGEVRGYFERSWFKLQDGPEK